MPACVCVEMDIRDPAAYERCRQLAPSSIAAFGGRSLARGGAHAKMLLVDGVPASP